MVTLPVNSSKARSFPGRGTAAKARILAEATRIGTDPCASASPPLADSWVHRRIGEISRPATGRTCASSLGAQKACLKKGKENGRPPMETAVMNRLRFVPTTKSGKRYRADRRARVSLRWMSARFLPHRRPWPPRWWSPVRRRQALTHPLALRPAPVHAPGVS